MGQELAGRRCWRRRRRSPHLMRMPLTSPRPMAGRREAIIMANTVNQVMAAGAVAVVSGAVTGITPGHQPAKTRSPPGHH